MRMFEKNGDFVIYVDGEYLMSAHCSYGDVHLIWPIHFEHPSADVEIRVVGSGEPYHEE